MPTELQSFKILSFQDFINEVHEAILRSRDVVAGWDQGIVPIFPAYHGNTFDVQDAGGGDNGGSRSNYRNIMGPVNPIPAAKVPEGMSRPKEPVLLPVDKVGGARISDGTNVNVVATGGHSGLAPGHTSTVKRCSTKDGGARRCVEEGEGNAWKVRSASLKQMFAFTSVRCAGLPGNQRLHPCYGLWASAAEDHHRPRNHW